MSGKLTKSLLSEEPSNKNRASSTSNTKSASTNSDSSSVASRLMGWIGGNRTSATDATNDYYQILGSSPTNKK